MNQTAKALFTDWYNAGIKKEATAEELKPKRQAIDKILLEKSKDLWVDIANVYFGFYNENEEGFQRVAKYFKDVDDFFPLKNVNLLRVLSGCLIAEKIEKNDAWASDILALSVIINPEKGDGIIQDLLTRAQKFYIKESEKKHDHEIIKNDIVLKTSLAKPVMPTMADHTGIVEFVKQLNAYLTGTTKDVSLLLTTVNSLITAHNDEIKKTYDALSEETNILWWLFGGYADTIDKPFSALSVELLSVLTAIELQTLTTILPGAGKITSIITKALTNTGTSLSEKSTIEQFIVSTSEYQKEIEKALIEQPTALSSIIPISTALKSYYQYSANEWKASLSGIPGIDLAKVLEPVKFTEQLYRELMLLRIYKISD
jgi:hypothetical protein